MAGPNNSMNPPIGSGETAQKAGRRLVELFPEAVEATLLGGHTETDRRNADIFSRRYGLRGSPVYTLEDLGVYYDLTRERIRQIESRLLKRLRAQFDGAGPIELPGIAALREAYSAVSAELRKLGWVTTEAELDTVLGITPAGRFDSAHLGLLMELLGYSRLPQNISGFRWAIAPSWYAQHDFDRPAVEALFRALDQVIDSVEATHLLALIVGVKKKTRLALSHESMVRLLATIPDLSIENEAVIVRLEALRSQTDKAYRLLALSGKPVNLAELAREINRLTLSNGPAKTLRLENLRNQMVVDERFAPVGRSGEWGLTRWSHVNRETIAGSLELLLLQRGEPMVFEELAAGMRELRPDASPNSIKTFLANDSRFARVEGGFALATWRLKG